MLSDRRVAPGSCLRFVSGRGLSRRDESSAVTVRVLECGGWRGGRYRSRCERLDGAIPAELIYVW
jgi:hypothetical protein